MNAIFRCVAVVAFASVANTSGAATIENGSFEMAAVTAGGFETYAALSGLLPGWTIARANIDHVGSGYWEASDGGQSIDLNGSRAGAALSQDITGLVIGRTYTIFFDLAGNPEGAPTVKTLDVSAGATIGSYSFDTNDTDTVAMGWETKSLSFTARGTSQLLSFVSTTGPNCCWGPALDNVRIVENTGVVPLPATGALLLAALGGLIGAARRKR